MKRWIVVSVFALCALTASPLAPRIAGGVARAADQPYRVVFDLTSRDTLDQKAVVRWIHEISTASPDVQIEVVMYGKGFELVMPERSYLLSDVQADAKKPNVKFTVCEIAMKNNKIERGQMIEEVQTVPDGIHEIVKKQQEGWGYIKVSH